MTLRSPYYEIDNPFKIYNFIKEEIYPTFTDEQEQKYNPVLIKLHRNCVRLNPLLRPSISEIISVLQHLTWKDNLVQKN